MHRRMARHAFEAARDGEQLLHPLVLLLHFLEVGFSSSALASVMSSVGGIALATRSASRVRDVHHAGHVADDRARFHGAERNDLGDVLAAVLVRDVLDDFAAPSLAEIDVDIRQRHPLRIQEALENQVVLDGVDVGDPQAVRDEAAGGRTAARPDRDALLARVPDEVPGDQEVPGYFICLIISIS